MKALIIDDELHAINRLKKLLNQIPEITEVVCYCDSEKALIDYENNKYEVVFLDIEMPVNGLLIFERIMEMSYYQPIIFTTAYNQYAVKAFELNAIDYLLKPFKLDRLKKSVNRVVEYYRFKDLNLNSDNEIKINCFKRLTMFHNSKIINGDWRTKKADELIAYLICEKGNFVSKDKIIANIWPESDSKKGMSSLYTTLYYIRQQENITKVKIPIESNRGIMRLNIDSVDIDIIKFEQLYESYKSGDICVYENMTKIYQGMLFEEHDYPWSVVLQSKYDNMFYEVKESSKT